MKKFAFTTIHTGSQEIIPQDNAALTMLTHWVSGPRLDDMEIGETGHIREASTADCKWHDGTKLQPIRYAVGRVE